MEQEIEYKIKSKNTIKITISILLILFLVVVGFFVYVFIRAFSGTPVKEKLAKFDKKVYSITSEDGIVQGFIATKISSCGEFPGKLCPTAYYNIIINEPLNTSGGAMRLGDSLNYLENIFPIQCDDADISKISPYYTGNHVPDLTCKNELSGDNNAFYVLDRQNFDPDAPDDFQSINTINMYDSSISERLIKSYPVSVRLNK